MSHRDWAERSVQPAPTRLGRRFALLLLRAADRAEAGKTQAHQQCRARLRHRGDPGVGVLLAYAHRRHAQRRDAVALALVDQVGHILQRLPFVLAADVGHGRDRRGVEADRVFDVHADPLVGQIGQDRREAALERLGGRMVARKAGWLSMDAQYVAQAMVNEAESQIGK